VVTLLACTKKMTTGEAPLTKRYGPGGGQGVLGRIGPEEKRAAPAEEKKTREEAWEMVGLVRRKWAAG
jgi:hypothetical protein